MSGPAPEGDQHLREAIEATLRRHKVASAQLSVALVDDAGIARLNEIHLGHQRSTDVLAFDLRDDHGAGAGQAPSIDGEIVLSVETATRESRKRGHDVVAEMALYAVHGTLHLLGYDDRGEEEAARMHDQEDEILVSLGLGAACQGGRGCG